MMLLLWSVQLTFTVGYPSWVWLDVTQPPREATTLGDSPRSAGSCLGLGLGGVTWPAHPLVVPHDVEAAGGEVHDVVLQELDGWPGGSALGAEAWWAAASVLCSDCAVAAGPVARTPVVRAHHLSSTCVMTGTGVTRRGLSGQVRGAIRGSGGGSSRSCALQFLRGIQVVLLVVWVGPGAALDATGSRRARPVVAAMPRKGAQRPGSSPSDLEASCFQDVDECWRPHEDGPRSGLANPHDGLACRDIDGRPFICC